ncbi:ArgS-related anticodon-binding protein NrtL [Streptantibioticus ferralitis]|uniref:arginine--tRNA ligase n=1 Tax=Streptantibioticus ferralitis TaxID=236510 RepID=A0ABT5YSQ9_9ACTN|nr:DALR anticodon-binding domain-containing protein [Streptantibioticus ferralitis]MDF2254518.1 DALR anticodon-binding domain-containing protein [Streptantibioticus ferralitis]
MTPAELSRTVLSAVRHAVEADELRVPVPERVIVERPRGSRQGDYATNVALRLAKSAGRQPRQVAEILAGRLADCPGIARVEITDPGFLNITLEATAQAGLVREVLARGAAYGHNRSLAGTRTTLTHDGEPRAAAVAEAGNRLLRACGAEEGPPEPVRVRAARPAPDMPPGDSRAPGRAPDLIPGLTPDAARWGLLRPPPGDAPRLDPGELLAQRESNPLFRVQYAHARARALLRNAHDLGIEPDPDGRYAHPAEHRLLGVLADFPRIVEAAARHRSPDRIARHLELTADAFFACHDMCPQLPRGDEKPSAAHRARLSLADAAGTVLAGGLTLLGISAPEHL